MTSGFALNDFSMAGSAPCPSVHFYQFVFDAMSIYSIISYHRRNKSYHNENI